jgi:hypothetical protein
MIANDTTSKAAEKADSPLGYYLSESRRPLTSLFLAAPLLAAYELGLLCLNRNDVANGADALLRGLLDFLGFSIYFLLPGLTIALLLAWHHLLRQPWRVSHRVLTGMVVECAGLAVGLWLVWRLQIEFVQSISDNASTSLTLSTADFQSLLGKIAGYCGAGIYEELLFRMILLSGAIGLLRWLHLSKPESVFGGIVLTSVIFSLAHYVGTWRLPFDLVTFTFRCLAGAYFAIIFRYRGFGIAAGTHAGYDVLVGMLARTHLG